MKQTSGFTILELLTVVAIVGILSAIAIPNVISWRNNASFRGGVNTLSTDLAVAKQTAIRLNLPVVTLFTATGYIIFVDDGTGTTDTDGNGILDGFGNGSRDGSETLVLQREIPPGMNISSITFSGNFTQFDGKGRCPSANTGGIIFTDNSNNLGIVSINRLGRVSIS